ncbi:RBBP9/YdeN family alpha/beta hydrolase [Sulfurospirillum barnesii]|uniref:Putative esterase of the alpha/beta hydrolase fold protein n=1 Tax=Sulfurospirillum barnesii (strain ATCC 700032 / DSM 10660 / SES-3) TaxID=760154 RepID=I3XW62_SULBS|nr:alpha/beta hydrolase [Sulfurospirillum barnesii]AFL68186.1 putative esterase of the alpha/beta hydrolase fold protein [Sulfurospirillum barnesii SES-3]
MNPSVLILPGYQNSDEKHWQSHWEKAHPDFYRVMQKDWQEPNATEWAENLEATLKQCQSPVVLVAHSLACLVVAQWASQAHTPIKGALLVAPPNPQEPLFPKSAHGFEKTPLNAFNFPSIILASTNDPYATFPYVQRLAKAWGSKLVDLGKRGHINSESDLGMWDEGYDYLETLIHIK